MAVTRTSEVFTPGKNANVNYIDRSSLEAMKQLEELELSIERGGFFTIVVGPTKTGKTVLVNRSTSNAFWVGGHNLTSTGELWKRLGSHFGIPVARTGDSVTADSTKWNFFSRFGIKPAELGAEEGGEHRVEVDRGATYEVQPDQAVPAAIAALVRHGHSVNLVIDDFHFVPLKVARSVIQAMKSVVHAGASLIAITLPHRGADLPALVEDVKGRTALVQVPAWEESELAEIAQQGFPKLRLVDPADQIARYFARESYGSPQLMQQMCLELCQREPNKVMREASELTQVKAPADWSEFHQYIRDVGSIEWIRKLAAGPKTRGRPRDLHLLTDGERRDAYAIILLAIRALGPRLSFSLADLQGEIASSLEDPSDVSRIVLGPKLLQMSRIAAQPLQAALAELDREDDYDVEALFAGIKIDEPNYQPVFEYVPESATNGIHILEPYLAYTLKWLGVFP